MEITVGGETITYSYKTQTDKNNVTRQYYRASIIVSTDLRTGTQLKKEITAPTEARFRAKIRALQQVRALDDGSLLPFQQYMEGWMRRNKNRLKPTTYAGYQYMLDRYLLPLIGSVKMADFNEDIICDLFNTLIDDFSLSTAHNARALLGRPMKEACEKYLTYGNPLSYVHLPKYQTAAIIPLSREEAKHMISLCREDSYGGPIALSLLLGLRISETIGLGIDAIDIPHRLVHIRRQINQVGSDFIIQNSTKNNLERILYLDNLSIEFIERELACQEQNRKLAGDHWKNEYNCLFTNSSGDFIKHMTLRNHLKALTAQIGRPDFKYHHLRHTAATILHENMQDIHAAKDLLGHKRYDSTGIYIHSSAEKLKQAAIAISNYIAP